MIFKWLKKRSAIAGVKTALQQKIGGFAGRHTLVDRECGAPKMVSVEVRGISQIDENIDPPDSMGVRIGEVPDVYVENRVITIRYADFIDETYDWVNIPKMDDVLVKHLTNMDLDNDALVILYPKYEYEAVILYLQYDKITATKLKLKMKLLRKINESELGMIDSSDHPALDLKAEMDLKIEFLAKDVNIKSAGIVLEWIKGKYAEVDKVPGRSYALSIPVLHCTRKGKIFVELSILSCANDDTLPFVGVATIPEQRVL